MIINVQMVRPDGKFQKENTINVHHYITIMAEAYPGHIIS
jgi:hypothetical protein